MPRGYNEDDESLSATKVDMYMSEMAKINAIRNPKQREKADNNLRNEMMPVSKEIEKFIELTNLIDDGGTIILGGCNAAYVQFTGDLVSSVSKLLNNRIKVVANQDETGDTMDKETKKGSGIYNSSFLNKGRSFYLNRGWSTSDLQVIHKKQIKTYN